MLTSGDSIVQFEIGELRNFIYLILDWTDKKAAIVDPQKDLHSPLEFLQANGFQLALVILTHTHHDHVAGVPEILARFPNIPIYLHDQDLHRLSKHTKHAARFQTVKDGATIQVGKQPVRIMHTPGHSAGEICIFAPTSPPSLLTGDTLFIRDCGRTDFADGSNEEMFKSLQKIKRLPPETRIFPGHHYAPECSSTLRVELETSAPLQVNSVDELAALP